MGLLRKKRSSKAASYRYAEDSGKGNFLTAASTSTSHSVAAHRALRTPSPVRAMIWRWRWVLVALVIAVIIQSALTSLAAANPRTAQVLVATTELSTGDQLTTSNTELADIPAELLPEGAINNPADAEGHIIMAPLPPGAPIFTQQLLTSAFVSSAPPGSVITTVTLDDAATLALIQPGDVLQLYSPAERGSDSNEAQLLTRHATVMAVKEEEASGGILNQGNKEGAVFVAISEKDANLVIGFGATTSLHAVITSR